MLQASEFLSSCKTSRVSVMILGQHILSLSLSKWVLQNKHKCDMDKNISIQHEKRCRLLGKLVMQIRHLINHLRVCFFCHFRSDTSILNKQVCLDQLSVKIRQWQTIQVEHKFMMHTNQKTLEIIVNGRKPLQQKTCFL